MLVTKPASTTFLIAPPSTMGLSVTPSLVNVTLSLTPGLPAGDQFPPEDQSVLPAAPLHNLGALRMDVEVVSTPARSAPITRSCCRCFIRQLPKTALRHWVDADRLRFRVSGFMPVPSKLFSRGLTFYRILRAMGDR